MALVKAGIIALRAPDGSFLPATPIYKELPVNERGRTVQEELSTEEISKLLAGKFKKYVDDCKAEERAKMQQGEGDHGTGKDVSRRL